MANGDSVFNPKKCDIPDVPPIEPLEGLEDCDVPVAPEPITDCPSPTIPLTGIDGSQGVPGLSIPGAPGADGADGSGGADGADGSDGLQGADGVDRILNTDGCCVWTWCECDESLSISVDEPPADLSCPKDDTCIDAPGRWLLQQDFSDVDCLTADPPCDVGKFFGQTKLECEAPFPEPAPEPELISSCQQGNGCCEPDTIFDQMILEIPDGFFANKTPPTPCDHCENIGGTYILQHVTNPSGIAFPTCLASPGDVDPDACGSDDPCARWQYREEACNLQSGFTPTAEFPGQTCFTGDDTSDGIPGVGNLIDLNIDLTVRCEFLIPGGRCLWVVCIQLIDRGFRNPENEPCGCVGYCCQSGDSVTYASFLTPTRDCRDPLVMPLSSFFHNFCASSHPLSVTIKGP